MLCSIRQLEKTMHVHQTTTKQDDYVTLTILVEDRPCFDELEHRKWSARQQTLVATSIVDSKKLYDASTHRHNQRKCSNLHEHFECLQVEVW